MKNRGVWLKLIISLILLTFVFAKVDWNAFVTLFGQVNLFYMLLAVLSTFAGFFLSTWKWRAFKKSRRIFK